MTCKHIVSFIAKEWRHYGKRVRIGLVDFGAEQEPAEGAEEVTRTDDQERFLVLLSGSFIYRLADYYWSRYQRLDRGAAITRTLLGLVERIYP
jgi:hypothetical protein